MYYLYTTSTTTHDQHTTVLTTTQQEREAGNTDSITQANTTGYRHTSYREAIHREKYCH